MPLASEASTLSTELRGRGSTIQAASRAAANTNDARPCAAAAVVTGAGRVMSAGASRRCYGEYIPDERELMPRKKQSVQVKQRQKSYRAGELSGERRTDQAEGRLQGLHQLQAVRHHRRGHPRWSASSSGPSTAAAAASTSSDRRRARRGRDRATPEAGAPLRTGAPSTIKQYSAPPAVTIDPAKTYTATIKTDKGDVTVELNAKDAPETVNNFVFLAKDGFYNGVTFYRVIAETRTATSPSRRRATRPARAPAARATTCPSSRRRNPFTAGVLAMAKPHDAGAAEQRQPVLLHAAGRSRRSTASTPSSAR